MRTRALLVDPGSLAETSDITSMLLADNPPTVATSLTDDLYATGKIVVAGDDVPPLGLLVRLVIDDEQGGAAVLGTFFATPSRVSRTEGLVITEMTLSSTLLALDSTQLTTTYVATSGSTALDVITDMCRLAGRLADTSGAPNLRYSEALFYEPGTSLMEVASEAAELASVRLATDEIGVITAMPASGTGTSVSITSLPSATTLTAPIEKDASGLSAPNRATAIFQGDDDTMLAASALLVGEMDAASRGRYIDISVDVSTMTMPSGGALLDIAQRALDDAQAVEWKITTTWLGVQAGDTVSITDIDAGETLVGVAQSVETTLDAICEQTMTVRGTVQ